MPPPMACAAEAPGNSKFPCKGLQLEAVPPPGMLSLH